MELFEMACNNYTKYRNVSIRQVLLTMLVVINDKIKYIFTLECHVTSTINIYYIYINFKIVIY